MEAPLTVSRGEYYALIMVLSDTSVERLEYIVDTIETYIPPGASANAEMRGEGLAYLREEIALRKRAREQMRKMVLEIDEGMR